jgi:hypothetical protein
MKYVATEKAPAFLALMGLTPAKFLGAVLKMNDNFVFEAV